MLSFRITKIKIQFYYCTLKAALHGRISHFEKKSYKNINYIENSLVNTLTNMNYWRQDKIETTNC